MKAIVFLNNRKEYLKNYCLEERDIFDIRKPALKQIAYATEENNAMKFPETAIVFDMLELLNNKFPKEEWRMKEIQTHSSADTSINDGRLPAIYTSTKLNIGQYESILDYGCGKFINHIKARAKELGVEWHGYDPYNQKGSVMVPADLVICSNVLNVIDSDDAMIEAIHNCFALGNKVIFSIYEGPDKMPVWSAKLGRYVQRPTGIGRETNPDQWQRNEPIGKYLELINSLGYTAEKKYGFIIGEGVRSNKATKIA